MILRILHRSSRQIIVPALVLALCLATACFGRKKPEPAPAPPPPPPECEPCPPPPEPKPDPAVGRLEEQNRKLELQLLERDSQIQEMEGRLGAQHGMLDEAIQEVVRAKAKLRSLESRAEAASQMAEAEIALKALEDQAGGEEDPEFEAIRQLLEMSSEEFENENFGGALYLSSQAKGRIQGAQMRLRIRERLEVENGEVLFAVPLSLSVTKPTNVREQPSLEAPVLMTLPRGSPVTGYSHREEWVRVKCEDGTRGWIHQSLLTRR
jgi:hypothetical protein